MSRRGLRPRRLGSADIALAALDRVRETPIEALTEAAFERVAEQLAELPDGGRRDLSGRSIVLMEDRRCDCASCRRAREEWLKRR